MVNVIWAMMAIIGIIYSLFNGTISDVNQAIFQAAEAAVHLTIQLVSVLVFWLGLMKIAEKANVLLALTKIFRPIIYKIFPEIPRGHPSIGYILTNITANLFGLGNAATPAGIKAMEELKTLSRSDEASRSMITFMAMNTAGLTLIPTTVLAIRMKHGSIAPTEIILPTVVATMITLCSALMIDRLFHYLDQRRRKG